MEEKKNWFSDCYRRNLVDMHIADWDDRFLSEFSPKAYFENLKRAHIQAPMLYLQSHIGHCYYPTKVGHMHRSLTGREDLIRQLVALCQKGGMHPVGYYSLIYNTDAEDDHPEWGLISGADGKTERQRQNRGRWGRYGHVCLNNPEYRAFVTAQIQEIADYFRDEDGALLLDGMFYDMTFWPGVCRCPHCRKRYAEDTGNAPETMPVDVDFRNPAFVDFLHLRERWMGEFARFVTDTTKACMPGVSVEHNYAHAVASDSSLIGSTELVNDACDYTGGDLYGSLYNHSFTAKYYYGVTKNQPFEYMTCRCDASLGVHTISKSDEHLAVEILLTAAHHGASFVIDGIDPVGTLNPKVYERIGRVFEKQMPYEPYFRGKLLADVGVYYPTSGRYNTDGQNFTAKTGAVRLTQTFIEHHIPTAVLSNRTENLNDYRAVFAPAVIGLPDGRAEALIEYVRNGGSLYFSGVGEPALLKEFFGAEKERFTDENAVYLAPSAEIADRFGEFSAKYPLPTERSLPVLKLPGDSAARAFATMTLPYTGPKDERFASIHLDPPGVPTDIPAVLETAYGKGRVMWSAAPLELADRYAQISAVMSLFRRVIGEETLSISADAPKQVELVTFRDGEETLLSAVDLLCTEELLPIRDFTVRVKCEKRPEKVVRLASADTPAESLPFTYENGVVSFRVSGLVMFAMFDIL